MIENNVRIIKQKVGLLNLAEELGNVSRVCQVMELSRDTFYRYKAAVEEGGVASLYDKSRRQPNLKNRVDELTEQAVLSYAIDYPAQDLLRVKSVMNYARRVFSFRPAVSVASGYIRVWLTLKIA
jgi:hypothetical protein